MQIRIIASLVIALCATRVALCADAQNIPASASTNTTSIIGDGTSDFGTDFIPTSELLARTPDETQCATAAFANALRENAGAVSETDSETDIQKWIYQTFNNADVLRAVLSCPEIASRADDETIKFLPITYTFPAGREIVVNYETQPKILKQRATLSEKRLLPSSDPNPRVGAPDDDAIWTNTDPAWYGIMVVQSGALDNFVGPNKNNTISLKYINDNIDTLFPRGNQCTGKSALTNDNTMINRAMRETVALDDDTNDYYVAGDANLQWLSYLEIGLDVAITVATMGGGTVVLGATKAARASRTLKNLSTTLRTLRQTDSVRDYVRISQQYARAAEELRNIDRVADAAGYARKSAEVENYARTMRSLESTDDNVRQYRQASETFSSLNQYRRTLRGWRIPQRGNIIARTWRAVRAANTGATQLRSAARVARSSTLSGRVRDWLFQSTLANVGALARLERAGGFIYGALKFVGGMYDWTETSTGDFTSGIEFKPLTLLSADDLQGQENVINHGMWLMWAGDAYTAADDDAAFLQAMDFANKFHFNLDTIQADENNHACDVDIYVVRPIIRNPGSDNPELYYLVMNDEPWTTHNTDE